MPECAVRHKRRSHIWEVRDGLERERGMDWDDVKPKPKAQIGEPLDTLSVKELEARIAGLEAEIVRVREELARKKAHEAAAAALFKS